MIGEILLYIKNVIIVTKAPFKKVKGTLNINKHVNKGGTPGIKLTIPGKISAYIPIIASIGKNFSYTGYITK